ncbi:CarD family transcriptional regulator [Lacrimispora saccharolytica]|uniref:Transcriptional regulator, CarD family n=1 Tax=Lacrimispora saccharolytica (strain ATCC 35040 / DSM 2544 / NRCC 2533 / WM1) TaxID=610130 RepID=D9R5C2_LACSW|nr:CarD family transcriptional regulator [Lacrimispora saccharolytica]ADL03328.1 transcriptional regulator, CarD family [[Clostridium] saccharolyticum WM1]QRV18511.1 CarD family transcriptional regulator [Lacrimispora saccharolytica]
MYQVGDNIVFGSKGICRVEHVGVLEIADMPRNKMYYTLNPYFIKGSKFYTPVDNDKVIMRPVIPKDEAMKLIDDIKNIDSLWVADEKRRESEYKEAMKRCDCRELVKIIKTIYFRKQSRLKDGKKLTTIDTKYFKLAEENFYGELAISLNMDVKAVKEFVRTRVKKLVIE